MAHILHHPAPGLGELLPGWFVVPSNPIVPAYRIPSIGELLPASFPIPQNPLIAAITSGPGCGMPNTSPTLGGMGCGCSAGCGSGMCGSQGMGGLSGLGCGCRGGMCGCGMGFLESMDPMTMALVAGGLVMLYLFMAPGGSEYKRELRSAKTAYEDRVARARSEHRGYKRAVRKTASRVRSGLEAAAGERKVTRIMPRVAGMYD